MNPPPNPAEQQAREAIQQHYAIIRPHIAPKEIILVTFRGGFAPTIPDDEIAAMLAAWIPDSANAGVRIVRGKPEMLTADQVRENNRTWKEGQAQC